MRRDDWALPLIAAGFTLLILPMVLLPAAVTGSAVDVRLLAVLAPLGAVLILVGLYLRWAWRA